MTASWSKTIQSVLACGPRVLFLPTKQSARPIYSHDNATWKSSIFQNALSPYQRVWPSFSNVGKYQNGTSYTRVSARHNLDARAPL